MDGWMDGKGWKDWNRTGVAQALLLHLPTRSQHGFGSVSAQSAQKQSHTALLTREGLDNPPDFDAWSMEALSNAYPHQRIRSFKLVNRGLPMMR